MTHIERIRALIDGLDLSDRQFAMSINMNPSQFSKYMLGYNEPSRRILNRIKEVYPQFEFEKVISFNPSNLEVKEPISTYEKPKPKKGNLMVIPLKAQAGYLNGYSNRVFLDSLEYFEFPLIKGECVMIEVDGFSMYPVLYPNDHVVCTELPEVSWLAKNKIYIFVTIDGFTVKYFDKIVGDMCYLRSENEDYNPVDPIPIKNIKKIFYKELKISK